MTEYLLYSKRCWIDDQIIEATIHIKDGLIVEIYKGQKIDRLSDTIDVKDKTSSSMSPARDVEESEIYFYDNNNLIIMPGIIDVHVHINEPGRTDWEGFETATKAAALGGVTTLVEMPLNTSPVTTNVEAFEIKKKAARNKLHVNCGFYGGVIPGNTDAIEALIKAGVFGIKGFLIHSGIDEFPHSNKQQLEEICPILAKYDVPLLLHCELETDEELPPISDPKSYQDYLHSRPPSWEINAIELAISLQNKYKCKVHIVHLSTAEALDIIHQQKLKSKGLTVETCAHYLYFNAEQIPDASPLYKCAPPIRDKANNQKLWQAVKDGQIDFLASDHSPAPPEIKLLNEGNLSKAWGGIAGLQFTLAALWAANEILTLEEFIPLLTAQPAKFIGLDQSKGSIKKGYHADLTVWDDEEYFTVTQEMVAHRHKESPYVGEKLKGKVVHCMVDGKFVVQNAKLDQLNAGKLLLKKYEND
ncbi:MAG: allantoinase AllB [Bacteroidetes bacterium]|nr:allantoinase AllB [Bacteroidota bacterium]